MRLSQTHVKQLLGQIWKTVQQISSGNLWFPPPRLLNNDELLILRVRVINPEMLGVVNNHIQEAGAIQPHINIFFACFTTRQARLMSTRPFPHEA